VSRLSAGHRSLVWLVGGFLFCPCHLPLTLGVLGVVSAGTAVGGVLREHVVLSALIITSVWLLATWRGLWLLRGGPTCTVIPNRGSQGSDR
jgi:hypothetical protein